MENNAFYLLSHSTVWFILFTRIMCSFDKIVVKHLRIIKLSLKIDGKTFNYWSHDVKWGLELGLGLVFGITILFYSVFPSENEWGSTWHGSGGGCVSMHKAVCMWDAASHSVPAWEAWGTLGPNTEELPDI